MAGTSRPPSDGHGLIQKGSLTAFSQHWQEPAATERAAFESLQVHADRLDFDCLCFPWASLVDALAYKSPRLPELLRNLMCAQGEMDRKFERLVTVSQHIHADRLLRFYQRCGITDVFWSHCTKGNDTFGGVRVRPFPLYPAQTVQDIKGLDLHAPREYFANFVGSFNSSSYLTDVRQHIFDDAGELDDCLIVQRDEWHFERQVYSEQMYGTKATEQQRLIEDRQKLEYLNALRNSVFTLCPSGSGPNSIRIGEALALGSVPIIITRSLALPGNVSLWESACVIEEDSVEGYRRALERARTMSAEELYSKQRATQVLYAYLRPDNYTVLISDALI